MIANLKLESPETTGGHSTYFSVLSKAHIAQALEQGLVKELIKLCRRPHATLQQLQQAISSATNRDVPKPHKRYFPFTSLQIGLDLVSLRLVQVLDKRASCPTTTGSA